MYRARFPQRLSNVHVALAIGVLLVFVISGSYHQDVKIYLANTQDHSISYQEEPPVNSLVHGGDKGHTVPSHDTPKHSSAEHATSGHKSPDHAGSPIHDNSILSQVHSELNTLVNGGDQGHKAPSHDAAEHSSPANVVTPRIPNIVHGRDEGEGTGLGLNHVIQGIAPLPVREKMSAKLKAWGKEADMKGKGRGWLELTYTAVATLQASRSQLRTPIHAPATLQVPPCMWPGAPVRAMAWYASSSAAIGQYISEGAA